MFMIIGIVFTPFQEMIENKTIRKARSHPMAKRAIIWICCAIFMAAATGCGTTYKAQPLPFKTPDAYGNTADVNGAKIGGRAFVDPQQAREAFGFDIRAAGMLPVQVVFDNQGSVPLVINPGQTFLVDNEGNLWPILTDRFAYERATKYAQTQNIFKEGAYNSFLGAAAGAIVGAAVGIVSNKDPLRSAGEGAAVGRGRGCRGRRSQRLFGRCAGDHCRGSEGQITRKQSHRTGRSGARHHLFPGRGKVGQTVAAAAERDEQRPYPYG